MDDYNMTKVETGIDKNSEIWVAIHLTHEDVESIRNGLEVIDKLAKTIGIIPEENIQAVMAGVSITVAIPRFVLKKIDKLYGKKGIVLLFREKGVPLPLPPGSKMPSPPQFPPSYWDMRSAEGKALYKDL